MTSEPTHVEVVLTCREGVPVEALHSWTEKLMRGLLDIEENDGAIADSSTGGCGATNTITVDLDVSHGGPLTAIAKAVTAIRGASLLLDDLRQATVAVAVRAGPQSEFEAGDDAYWATWRREQWEQVREALGKLDGTRKARVALLSGLSRERLDELGWDNEADEK